MTLSITALHKPQGDQVVTALGNLPGPDDYMSHDDLVALARQIQQASIDNQRLAHAPLLFGGNWHRGTGIVSRHDMTPNYLEYPTLEESCDFEPIGIDSEGGSHD